MNKLERYAIVISLAENLSKSGSWCGETHIQKSVYFMKKLFSKVIDYPFILYKHGPFSFELRDDIGIMIADRYLKIVPMFPYGPKILPGELAGKIKELFPNTLRKNREKIKFVTGKLADKNAVELEARATALYITKEAPLGEKNMIRRTKELCNLKPHIPFDSAKEAVEEIDEIVQSAKKQIDEISRSATKLEDCENGKGGKMCF